IGFIFGYQSNRRYYVASWRKEDEYFKSSLGEGGWKIMLVDSLTGPGAALDIALFISEDTSNQTKLLWKDPKKVGWDYGKPYRWNLIHRPSVGLIRMKVYSDGVLM